MKTLVLFGRSPFINKVDVNRIIAAGHDTAGCNDFAAQFEVKTSWCMDKYIEPKSEKTTVFTRVRNNVPVPPGTCPIRVCSGLGPLLTKEFDGDYQKLNWVRFTPCLILNWALLEGYTEVYLVGIDHIPTDTQFEHFDGIDSEHGRNLNPEMHEAFRAYVAECAKHMKIYQTNPNVMRWWALPYRGLIHIYG